MVVQKWSCFWLWPCPAKLNIFVGQASSDPMAAMSACLFNTTRAHGFNKSIVKRWCSSTVNGDGNHNREMSTAQKRLMNVKWWQDALPILQTAFRPSLAPKPHHIEEYMTAVSVLAKEPQLTEKRVPYDNTDHILALLLAFHPNDHPDRNDIYLDVLDSLLSSNRYSDALAFFTLARSTFTDPSECVGLYRRFLFSISHTNEASVATTLLDMMTSDGLDPQRCAPYVLHAVTKCDKERGKSLLMSMINNWGYNPSNMLFHPVLNALVQDKNTQPQEVMSLVRVLRSHGVPHNQLTYNHIVNMYTKNGKLEEAHLIITSMLKRGIEPSVITYQYLLEGYVTAKRMKEAKHLFNMIKKHITPSLQMYTELVHGYMNAGMKDDARGLVDEMMASDIPLDMAACNAALYEAMEWHDKARVYSLLQEMWKRGIPPRPATYAVVIRKFLGVDLEFASKLIKEMNEKKLVVSSGLYGEVMEALEKSKKGVGRVGVVNNDQDSIAITNASAEHVTQGTETQQQKSAHLWALVKDAKTRVPPPIPLG